MARWLLLTTLLVCAPLMAATWFTAATNVECANGLARLAPSWRPLLEQGFDTMPQTWKLQNYEDDLEITTAGDAHSGAGALWLRYAKEKDTAWELTAPPVPLAGVTTVRLHLWLSNNRSLVNTNPHKDSYFSCVEFHGADGAVVGRLPIAWGGANEQWHAVDVTGPVPAGAATAVLRLGWDGPDLSPGEYVAIDDLQLLGRGQEPMYEASGEFTTAPLALDGPGSVTVDALADTPAKTAVQVQIEGQKTLGDPWQAAGAPITRTGAKALLPAWRQFRVTVRLTTATPALSPALRSVKLTAGRQVVRLEQFQGVDTTAPRLAEYGPTRAAQSPAALQFRVVDDGIGMAPKSVSLALDGELVPVQIQPDGKCTYGLTGPLTPPALGAGFVGWRTGNHASALTITRTPGRPGSGGEGIHVTRAASPTDTAFSLTSPPIAIVGGSAYVLSFWVRSSIGLESVYGFGGGVQWLDADGKPIGDPTPVTYGPQSGDWRQVQQPLTAPANAAAVTVTLGWDNPNLADGQFVEFADPGLAGPRSPKSFGPNVHQVRVQARDWAGNTLDRTWFVLVKELPTAGKVTVRDDGVTLIDGKPFFPIGIYSVSKRPANNNSFDDAFKELRAAGFNLAHTYANARNADFAEFYAAAQRQGMKLWVAPETGNNSTDAAGAIMTVAKECNEPALLAWYLADDTAGWIGPDELRAVSEAVRDVDPFHITVQADGIGGVNDDRYVKYINSTTGFLPEIYPIHQKTGNHVADVIRSMENVRAGWKAAGRVTPVWAIIQDFEGWGWQRFPTDAEERLMVYLALIHGAQGMTWYTYSYRDDKHGAPWDPQKWAYLKRIATELSSLGDLLTSRDPQEKVQTTILSGPEKGDLDYPSLNLRLKHFGGKWVLLAANSAEAPIKVRLGLPGVKDGAEVLFEGRKVSAKGGAIEDEFAPFAVHVYQW